MTYFSSIKLRKKPDQAPGHIIWGNFWCHKSSSNIWWHKCCQSAMKKKKKKPAMRIKLAIASKILWANANSYQQVDNFDLVNGNWHRRIAMEGWDTEKADYPKSGFINPAFTDIISIVRIINTEFGSMSSCYRLPMYFHHHQDKNTYKIC